MQGNDLVWLASIIVGMTVLGWLVLDWLESAQQWDALDVDTNARAAALGKGEQQTPDAIDVELELMLCYPLDPFAPALLWRPQPQDEWVEGQESASESASVEAAPVYRPSESA